MLCAGGRMVRSYKFIVDWFARPRPGHPPRYKCVEGRKMSPVAGAQSLFSSNVEVLNHTLRRCVDHPRIF
jgi:hypothetical protein